MNRSELWQTFGRGTNVWRGPFRPAIAVLKGPRHRGASGRSEHLEKPRRDGSRFVCRQESCRQQDVVQLVGVARIRTLLLANAFDRCRIERTEIAGRGRLGLLEPEDGLGLD